MWVQISVKILLLLGLVVLSNGDQQSQQDRGWSLGDGKKGPPQDISSGFLEVIQSGASPIAVANGQNGQAAGNYAPSSAWNAPLPLGGIDTLISQAGSNGSKPVVPGSQLGVFLPLNQANDPGVLDAPLVPKPPRPEFLQQVIGIAPAINTSIASFLASPTSATTESGASSGSAMNDPLPNPVQGLVDSSQAALTNASSAVQGATGQWGTNVQNGLGSLLGSSFNRPSNGQDGSATLQGVVDNSQASIANATAAAQGWASQLGSNAQNGISNVFGLNLNRPSSDETVPQPSEATSATEAATTTTTTTTTSSEGSTATTTTTTTKAPESTTATTTTSTTAGNPYPFVSFVNKTQSLINTGALQQALAGPLSASIAQGLSTYFLPRPATNTTSSDPVVTIRPVLQPFKKPVVAPPLADTPQQDVAPPMRPTCPTCSSGCSYRPFQGRIIGGSPVPTALQYPFVALLTYSGSPSGHGSLINDRAIVTTANIIQAMPTITNIRAILGLVNRTDTNATPREISAVYVHPGFQATNLVKDNIGLLILKTPLSTFVPICLPTRPPTAGPTPIATVIGWGATYSNGPLPLILQEADLQMYPPLVCNRVVPDAVNILCGGFIKPSPSLVSTCTGDGGDPLVELTDTSYELIGVSIDLPGYGCAEFSQPALFTNIVPYVDWIVTYGPGCECFDG